MGIALSKRPKYGLALLFNYLDLMRSFYKPEGLHGTSLNTANRGKSPISRKGNPPIDRKKQDKGPDGYCAKGNYDTRTGIYYIKFEYSKEEIRDVRKKGRNNDFDTLWSISRRFGVTLEELAERNGVDNVKDFHLTGRKYVIIPNPPPEKEEEEVKPVPKKEEKEPDLIGDPVYNPVPQPVITPKEVVKIVSPFIKKMSGIGELVNLVEVMSGKSSPLILIPGVGFMIGPMEMDYKRYDLEYLEISIKQGYSALVNNLANSSTSGWEKYQFIYVDNTELQLALKGKLNLTSDLVSYLGSPTQELSKSFFMGRGKDVRYAILISSRLRMGGKITPIAGFDLP